MRFAIIACFFCYLLSSFAYAENERGTRQEAIELAQKAADYLKEAGPEKAFPAFNDPKSQFRYKDLYVFVQDFECTFYAHGLNPKLIGKNIWKLKNPNGRYACQDIMNATKKSGTAWTDYIFEDPKTGKLAEKSTYSIAVGKYVIMVGIYK